MSDINDPFVIAPDAMLGGRYRLRSRIGHGGMAMVWLAVDERLERPVAVKILSDTLAGDSVYLQRFQREARVAAGLQHPNLVPIYDFDAGSRPYLVMEYVEGGDLAERIRAGDAPDAEALAQQLLAALRHIHAAGVLHRDIKPQNVLVDDYGAARLTDFGIAQPADAASLTNTGQVIGTETYLAPEVMRGEPATERSDLYSLGVVLAKAAQSSSDPNLWELIDRLREKDPLDRPRDAGEALAELDTAPLGEPTQPLAFEPDDPPTAEYPSDPTPAEPLPPPPVSRAPRRRWWPVAALAGVLIAIGAVAVASSGGDEDPNGSRQANAGNSNKPEEEPAPAETVTETSTAIETTEAEEPEPAPETETASTDGVALNDQGFEMINSGDPEGAVPVLEEAVAALEDSGDEQTYNYALFNLARALRLSGRPDEAIPLLEQRLNYPDQTETVEAELAAAQQEAGDVEE